MNIQQFLETSYTAFHTVANCKTILNANGFEQLTVGKKWNLKKGGKY